MISARVVARCSVVVGRRAFFTAEPKNPPSLVMVGVQAALKYNPSRRVDALVQSEEVLKTVAPSALNSALALVDQDVASGPLNNSFDYVTALNASIAAFAEEDAKSNGALYTEEHNEKISAISHQVHQDAIKMSLEENGSLIDIVEAIKRSGECQIAMVADGGYLLKEIVEQQFPRVFNAVGGNILTSCELGQSILTLDKSFKTIASRMFVQTKDALFIDTQPQNIKAAQRAGCQTHQYRGTTVLQEELVRLGLTYKKNPITGAITEKSG